MPKVIIKSCYIKSSAHFINYLEYAGEKLEAQTLVFNDGTEFMAEPDELLDISKIKNLRYVQIELKDGTTRRFSPEKYQRYLVEETEKFLEIETVPVSGLSEEDEKSLRNIPPEQYLDYIAFRPGAEKNPNCSHGLFGINGAVNIDTVKGSVLENEKSYKWSHIISLTREDAEAAGFDNRKAWENLIKAYAYDIGRLYNIPPDHLEIMAAYHDKSYHPHCHLYFYSNQNTTAEGCAGFNQGDLAKKSEKLRSLFTTKIFQEQTAHLSKEKYQLRENISNELKKFVQEIGKADYKPDKEIVNKFIELSNSLSDYSGRAYYAYLSPEQKQKVVEFLRTAVSSDSNLNQIYKKMIENQLSFISMYNDDKTKIENRLNDYISRFFEPKSKNDMKKLHNIIIEQAMIYNQKFLSAQESNGVVRKDEFSSFSNDDTSEESFVDDNEQILDEDSSNAFDEVSNDSEQISYSNDSTSDTESKSQTKSNSNLWTKDYLKARFLLYGDKTTPPDLTKAYTAILKESDKGNALAMHDLGKMLLNGLGCEKDIEVAQKTFAEVLDKFKDINNNKENSYIQYRIGKMYEFGYGTKENATEAANWYRQAVSIEKPNSFAAYSLGNLYFNGNGVNQDYLTAFNYFKISATAEKNPNAYAMYKLGEMYADGTGIESNVKQADIWYSAAYSEFLDIEKNNNDDYILYKLGNMNYKGLGTKRNLISAEKYYLRAAELENLNAYYGLGQLYSNKEFKSYNIEKSIDYYNLIIDNISDDNNTKTDLKQFAQYALGKLYLENDDVKDISKAIKYFEVSAERNNQFAQYNLGKIYLDKYSKSENQQDIFDAIDYLQESANQKNPFAAYLLGNIYAKGIGIETDENAAQKHYTNAFNIFEKMKKSDTDGSILYKLGIMYLNGLGTEKIPNLAIEYFKASAHRGNAFAAYFLGNTYMEGVIVKSDEAAAQKWYTDAYNKFLKIAASDKDGSVYYKLGYMNINELGTKKNINQTIKFYILSANCNNQYAQYALGKLFLENKEIAKDINLAVNFLTASANQKNEYAQYTLGRLYLEEENLRNIEQGITLLDTSAEQGNVYAQYFLGKAYFDGIGVNKDIKKALGYYQKYADEGNQFSQYTLGKIYYYGYSDENGFEIKKDLEKAISYFKASAKQGNVYAKNKLLYISEQHKKEMIYAASLLLSRLAYAMASLIIQNTQNREDEMRRKNNNHKAKFASKNHQITKAHFEPQTPIQY